MNASSAERLQATLRREVEIRELPGANAEIFADGVSIWCGGAGTVDRGSRERMPSGATFPIYSITKTFTAVAALRLATRGVLALDESIDRWLPDLPFSAQISLRQLLGHTAGVFNYSALPEYHEAVAKHPGDPWSFEEFTLRTCQRPLDFVPGAGWSYSNTGYTLVKRILEVSTEGSFAKVMHREVISPAGLENTFALERAGHMLALVPGYSMLFTPRMRGPLQDVRNVYHPGWCGTGVLASTSTDLCRFFEGLFTGRLLEPGTLTEMLRLKPVKGHHPPAVTPGYGLGIMGDPDGALGAEYGHGGGGPGWNLRAIHLPELAGRRVTVAVLCNHDADHAEPIARALVERS